jgi:hypothetical protein
MKRITDEEVRCHLRLSLDDVRSLAGGDRALASRALALNLQLLRSRLKMDQASERFYLAAIERLNDPAVSVDDVLMGAGA